jgi:hypothetical protein
LAKHSGALRNFIETWNQIISLYTMLSHQEGRFTDIQRLIKITDCAAQ